MRKKLLFTLALFFALIGCETGYLEDEVIDPSCLQVDVTVDVGFETSETRMSVTPDSSNEVWTVEWEQDDQVTGWFSDGSTSAFEMISLSSDANYATFKGVAPTGTTMRLIYPCDEDALDLDGNLAIDLSTQVVDMNDPYMVYGDNNMYMLSDEFAASSNETAYPTMHHLMAGMELVISPININDGEYIPYRAVIKGLGNYATVNFADCAVTSTDGSILLNISNASQLADLKKTSLPFSIVPFTTTGSEEVTIELYFLNGSVASIVKSDITPGLEFKAGEHGSINIIFNAETDLIEGYALSDFSSSMELPVGDIWVVTDASVSDADSFSGLEDALKVAYNAGRDISVVFPNLTSLVASAFNSCYYLTSIELPAVTSVGNYAFFYCSALKSIGLPAAKSIGNYAFYRSALTSIDLPSATSIGSYAFQYSKVLTAVDIPLATSLSNYAFYNCESLTDVNLPATKTIGVSAFSSCYALKTIDMPALTTVGIDAFYYCDALTTVNMPVATTIGEYAFSECLALESITLPKVTTVSNYAFMFCSNLVSIELPIVTTLGANIFYDCGSLQTMSLGLEGPGLGLTTSTVNDVFGSLGFYPENTTLYVHMQVSSSYYASGNTLIVTDLSGNQYTHDFKSIEKLAVSSLEVNKSSLSLNYIQGSQVSVTVTTYLDDISSITAVSDNDKFDVSISGSVITLTALETNTSTSEAITGNLTITVGEGDLLKEVVIPVTQNEKLDAAIAVSSSAYVGFTTGSTVSISVTTNMDQTTISAVSNSDLYTVAVSGTSVIVTTTSENTHNTDYLSGEITITVGEEGNSASATVTVYQKPNGYYVGNIYDDGVDRGVIWWVADDYKSCKITPIESSNDSKVVFTTYSITSDYDIDAYDVDNGYANTMAYATSSYYSATTFPIIAWALAKGDGWYIPSKNEYITMLPLYWSSTTFATAIESGGGGIQSDFYWSSTMSGDSKAWAIKYWGKTSYTHSEYGITNTSGRYARVAKLISLEEDTTEAAAMIIVDRTATVSYTSGSTASLSVSTNMDSSTISAVSNSPLFSVSVSGTTVKITALSDNTDRVNSVTGEIVITVGSIGNEASATITVTQSPNYYTVGEVYDDGVDRGVIWWVASDYKSCKILSLESSADSRIVFTTYSIDSTYGIDAYDYSDGYSNTMAFANSSYYTAETFPLIAWILSKGDGWYLPAYNEYAVFFPMYYSNSTFKSAITSHGGSISSEFYWASTLSSSSGKCWAIKYSSASSYYYSEYGITNSSGRYARAAKLISVE